MIDTRLDWLWKENMQRQKKLLYNQLKTEAGGKVRCNRTRRKRELKTLPKEAVTYEEVKAREAYPLLRQRLNSWPNLLVKDVLAKFGVSPVCFFTGLPIDYSKTETYHLDHIIPKARGGLSTLDNMQLVNPVANLMKRDYPVDEFLCLCRLIAAKHPG